MAFQKTTNANDYLRRIAHAIKKEHDEGIKIRAELQGASVITGCHDSPRADDPKSAANTVHVSMSRYRDQAQQGNGREQLSSPETSVSSSIERPSQITTLPVSKEWENDSCSDHSTLFSISPNSSWTISEQALHSKQASHDCAVNLDADVSVQSNGPIDLSMSSTEGLELTEGDVYPDYSSMDFLLEFENSYEHMSRHDLDMLPKLNLFDDAFPNTILEQ